MTIKDTHAHVRDARMNLLLLDRTTLNPVQAEMLRTVENHLNFAADLLDRLLPKERENGDDRNDRSNAAGVEIKVVLPDSEG